MSRKFRIAAVLLTTALFAFGGFYARTQAARAQGAADPNTTCGSPMPCLVESNSGSGSGVKSASSSGNGLIGTTKALGSTNSNGRSGLFGQDLQTASGHGLFNFGVSGTSTNGTGVQGSGAVGVAAVTNSANGTGLLVSAPNTSLNTALVKGIGYNNLPVFSVDSVGNAVFGDASIGAGGGVTARGYAGNNLPLFTAANQNGNLFTVFSGGLVAVNSILAVEPGNPMYADAITAFGGTVHVNNAALDATGGFFSEYPFSSGTNFLATDSPGVTWLYQGYSSTAQKYTVEMGDSGSVYARVFITMNAAEVAQPTSTGSRVNTYTPQITEPSLEDFGEAQLDGGVANVRLDPRFAAAMDKTMKYFVTLTPEGDCRGLFVAQRDADSFVVRELQGGRSSISFTYRIVAKPLGNDSPRLASSTLPYGFDHRVPPPVVIHRRMHVTPPRIPTKQPKVTH